LQLERCWRSACTITAGRFAVQGIRRLAVLSLFVSAFAFGRSAPGNASAGDVAPAQLVVDGQYSDDRFLDMMSAHHAMAIAMAQVEIQQGARPELVQLARGIVGAQTKEIDEMRQTKQQLYGTARVPLRMNSEQMQNGGMLAPDQLGHEPDVDLAFIDSMIPHHAEALAMASVARLQSRQASIVKLARGIIDSQSREIGEMVGWRQQWFDGAR
jgi:uncharacterized protein (DUF305 family)